MTNQPLAPKEICYNCGKSGHRSIGCRDVQRTPRCIVCSRVGSHTVTCLYNTEQVKVKYAVRQSAPVIQLSVHGGFRARFDDPADSLTIMMENGSGGEWLRFYGNPTHEIPFLVDSSATSRPLPLSWKPFQLDINGEMKIGTEQGLAYLQGKVRDPAFSVTLLGQEVQLPLFLTYLQKSFVIDEQNGTFICLPSSLGNYLKKKEHNEVAVQCADSPLESGEPQDQPPLVEGLREEMLEAASECEEEEGDSPAEMQKEVLKDNELREEEEELQNRDKDGEPLAEETE